ncbi:thiaminase II [Macrococcus brunensis]|uniref:thiaminase II n=1 Tax=Macrococcus brunensis TaxID=198483 RepID=UPI001EEF9CA1|nr:thiaminase II [Macrococcus brunensis]ULG74249.1 thiaminase II [Macrococcus brunensis]
MFTERLFERVEPIWNSYLEHPFVKGLGDGTLDLEKFKHWLKQDYIYLIEYARLFAVGASKATDLAMMTTFGELLHGTLATEMALHRSYAAQFGITQEELEAVQAAEVTESYTSYMLKMAHQGGVEYTIAAVLACTWSYHYIGEHLAASNNNLGVYQEWVDMYHSPEFTELKDDCIRLMNEAAEGKSEAELKVLEEIVVKTSYYEYLFWDMAENISNWPCKETV